MVNFKRPNTEELPLTCPCPEFRLMGFKGLGLRLAAENGKMMGPFAGTAPVRFMVKQEGFLSQTRPA